MNLANLKILVRGYTPGAKAQVITSEVLGLILNEGVRDIAAYTVCLKANKKFTITADQSEYLLSTVIGDYLTPDAFGLWWNNGSKWVQLNARTLTWLDKNRPNWRDLDSGTPQDYFINGDILTLVPTPNTTLAEGLWFYYGATPGLMEEEDDYSFSGSNVELTHLSVFNSAILKFAEWKINPILNKDQTEDITEGQYKRAREEAFTIFKRRKDISNSSDARLSGPLIRR